MTALFKKIFSIVYYNVVKLWIHLDNYLCFIEIFEEESIALHYKYINNESKKDC